MIANTIWSFCVIYLKLISNLPNLVITTSQSNKFPVKIASLKQERDDLKKELDTYDKTKDVKTEEMRNNLVQKLEALNEKISDYNKSLKK